MFIIPNPNEWSCLPAAFASALSVRLEAVLGCIGHDGSEITHPDLDEPLCRRGFHPQEMIKMCLLGKMGVTRVELHPSAMADGLTPHTPKVFDIGGWGWFQRNLFTSTGVIECRTSSGAGHAMAYDGTGIDVTIMDPASGGSLFGLNTLQDAEKRDRFLVALWRIEDLMK